MKDNVSHHEIEYIRRRIGPKLKRLVASLPVTVLTGARQVGKSTLLRHEFPDFTYLTLDDFAVREQALTDPQSLWKGSDRVIIDEAQKQPELFDAIKLAVDRSHRRKKFILSGSANLLLMERVTESLAGRAAYCELLPMTYGEEQRWDQPGNFTRLWREDLELTTAELAPVDPIPLLLRGFMPPMLHLADRTVQIDWLEGYVHTYLERDLRDLSQVDSLVDFRKIMRLLALRTGNILNQADVARDADMSHATTHRYIKLLEVSNLITRVPAFGVNRTRRLVKSPKVFFVDPALAIFLSGYYDGDSLARCRELGGFFETLVGLHLRARCEAMTPRAGLHYWRTVAGQEVDFVIEHGTRLLAFEAKRTVNPVVGDIKGLLAFLQEYPETVHGVLVHAGPGVTWLHSQVVAVPWWWLDG